MAVITAYGHLGTLQNKSGSAATAIPRMLILILFPISTAVEFILHYLIAITCIALCRIEKRAPLKNLLMIVAGVRVPYVKQPTNDTPETCKAVHTFWI